MLRIILKNTFRTGHLSLQGEKLPHKPLVNHAQVCTLTWHPTRKILAVGWQTGEISLWNEQEQELIDAPHMHKGELSILHWSSSGSRLVSGDKVKPE